MIRFKKYQVFICSLILVAVCFMCPQTSVANPPNDVPVSYDSVSQILMVTITHKSSFTNFHYIKNVEIKNNGNIVSRNKYKNQPDQATFTYRYTVPAKAGETLEVKAGLQPVRFQDDKYNCRKINIMSLKRESGNYIREQGFADAVAFGKPFI